MEPIFDAVLKGEREVAGILLKDSSAVHSRMQRDHLIDAIPHWLYVGDTSLHLAAARLDVNVARVLVEAGADANATNRRGGTPLHYACDARPRLGGTWNPSHQAALIELLVKHGAEIDRGDRGGVTPLHRAVRARSPMAVRQLLALGARTDCALKAGGSTPLRLAMRSTGASGTADSRVAQDQIIELLLEHGAVQGP